MSGQAIGRSAYKCISGAPVSGQAYNKGFMGRVCFQAWSEAGRRFAGDIEQGVLQNLSEPGPSVSLTIKICLSDIGKSFRRKSS
jgi:hypothetical protein